MMKRIMLSKSDVIKTFTLKGLLEIVHDCESAKDKMFETDPD